MYRVASSGFEYGAFGSKPLASTLEHIASPGEIEYIGQRFRTCNIGKASIVLLLLLMQYDTKC